jgi:16S rRNA (adenine1518-N6/adenine1519-N6)-dimethyltransferase
MQGKNHTKQYRAKKSLGQNFLKSEVALKKIVEAGEIKPGNIILEIGPGKGVLTSKLLGSRCKVLAIEKDKELFEFLKIKFEKEIQEGQLDLIPGDILEFQASAYGLEPSAYKIIANIPYNITGAILKKFLTEECQPEAMVLMVQHEVAQRIIGKAVPASAKIPTGRKESVLSISVKAYGEPKMIAKVDKRYFSPAPKVKSAIISIKNISREKFKGKRGEDQIIEEKFWKIVKAGFAHKRKKLSGNLKGIIPEEKLADPRFKDKRAEDLSLSDWMYLAEA